MKRNHRTKTVLYIQKRSFNSAGRVQIETVAECKTNKEAIKLISKFSSEDPNAKYYTMQRPCDAYIANQTNTENDTIKPKDVQTSNVS